MVRGKLAQDKKPKVPSLPTKRGQYRKLKISSVAPFSRKAQMKIQQTAFMLLAITLFFVLIGMFVFVFRFSGLKETANLLEQENAMLLVSKLANSPEFSCGGSFGTQKVSCIDENKVLALKKNIENYEGFWDVSNIEIIKIYPELEEIEIYSSPGSAGEGYTVSNFVSICKKDISEDGVYNKCEIAQLIVGYKTNQ